MVRIAFVMDRVFRHFGLSGKSFIPLLIASGCGIPGIMASKTIENDNDRRLTIMTATFIPCGAKLPVIALLGGIMVGWTSGDYSDAGNTAFLMYALGIVCVLVAAIMLKKTKPFSGEAAPFVMELPAYHIPSAKTVLMHTWERLWGFIKKAGTILFLACVIMWILSTFGFENGAFGMVEDTENCLMAILGSALAWIFTPLGWGKWQCVAAAISGFSAKEGIVSTMGVLANVSEDLSEETDVVAAAIRDWFPTMAAAFSFLVFNLLNYDTGFINGILVKLGMEKWQPYSDKSVWPPILIVVYLWQVTGYNSVVYFASICGIDTSIIEAARVDGANCFQKIRYIVLPSLRSTIVILLLFALGGIVKGNFGLFYNIVGTNPMLYDTTDIIETYVYRSTITDFNFSTASAVGLYQSIIGFCIVMASNFAVKKIDPEYALF